MLLVGYVTNRLHLYYLAIMFVCSGTFADKTERKQKKFVLYVVVLQYVSLIVTQVKQKSFGTLINNTIFVFINY